MSKILISGPSGISCGLGNRLEIISNVTSIREAHESIGDVVEQRPIIPGEDLDRYSRVYLVQQTIASWSAPFALGFLYAVAARKDSIICFDDWQAPEAFKLDRDGKTDGLINCAWNPKLTREHRERGESVKNLINEGIETLCNRNNHKYLLPVFMQGKWQSIRCHGIAIPYSPYPFMRQYKYLSNDGRPFLKRRRWVMASLQDNSRWIEKQDFSWDILYYGVKKFGQQRITEAQLAKVYASSWGVISPPHPKLLGTGWFRVRVPMAMEAGSILIAPYEDAVSFFGSGIKVDSRIIKQLEAHDDKELNDMVETQREHFLDGVWNKDQFLKFIGEL